MYCTYVHFANIAHYVFQDLDSAVAKVSDLRVRLSKLGENSRRDVDSLQTKLTKVTDGSRSRITELEKENYEVTTVNGRNYNI